MRRQIALLWKVDSSMNLRWHRCKAGGAASTRVEQQWSWSSGAIEALEQGTKYAGVIRKVIAADG